MSPSSLRPAPRARLAALALAAALGAGAAVGRPARPEPLPFYRTPELAPEWIAPDAPGYAAIHRVADFALVNQAGDTVGAADVDGKVYVASFFFTDCRQLCPILRSGLRRVQDAFAGDDGVLILSHTVVPEADDVAALERYARANGVVPGRWHLLRGRRAEVERLARESYFVGAFADTAAAGAPLRHTETLVLVDGRRRIRGVYDGSLQVEIAKLIEDLSLLTGRPATHRK